MEHDCVTYGMVKDIIQTQGKILDALARIEAQGAAAMAAWTDVKQAVAATKAHTDALALVAADVKTTVDTTKTRIEEVIAILKSGSPSPADLQDAADTLTAANTELDDASTNLGNAKTNLTAIGVDPSNPLPPVPPLV